MNIKKEIKELNKLAEALKNVSREWVNDTENEKLSKARYSLLDQSQLLACKIILQMIGVRATTKRIEKLAAQFTEENYHHPAEAILNIGYMLEYPTYKLKWNNLNDYKQLAQDIAINLWGVKLCAEEFHSGHFQGLVVNAKWLADLIDRDSAKYLADEEQTTEFKFYDWFSSDYNYFSDQITAQKALILRGEEMTTIHNVTREELTGLLEVPEIEEDTAASDYIKTLIAEVKPGKKQGCVEAPLYPEFRGTLQEALGL